MVIDYRDLKTDMDFKLWLVDLPLPLHMRHRWVKLGHRSFFEVMIKAAARNPKATFEIKFPAMHRYVGEDWCRTSDTNDLGHKYAGDRDNHVEATRTETAA